MEYKLESEFAPAGDQPQAIQKLIQGVKEGNNQVLLGVTGSGKTFTIANVIAQTQKNTLVISHNKTLAIQLYSEFRQFFPNNNVGYFVSYYDYYQPESYLAQTDTYIEKETQINEKIEKMRLEATAMLLSGEPTIIVATISCIYSLGNPADWNQMAITLQQNQKILRRELIKKFIDARYERNDMQMASGNFRVKGDTIDLIPAYSQEIVRITLFGDEVEKICILDAISLQEKKQLSQIKIFPAKHYLVAADIRERAIESIKGELEQRLPELGTLERQRLEMRTKYDLEMIEELGYCSGIENYSRHFDGRKVGEAAFCLLDFFADDYLLVIDESHVTLPQARAMYEGDHSRKRELITHGFRLPSAFDNRPLRFKEFERYLKNTIFVSATPASYEREHSDQIVEQLVRPTGLLDPQVEVRPTKGQMDDLIGEIGKRADKDERVLVTTLTKQMAEDLAGYLSERQVKVRYMHSEIQGLQRMELLRQLRLGEFTVLVGINLLREGLDIPEVSLVAILDADKEGFLRNVTSLIQTFGRAARNVNGAVILYAENSTESMKMAQKETRRRRQKQMAHNQAHGITPKTIIKSIPEQMAELDEFKHKSAHDLKRDLIEIEVQMEKYARELAFEKAIECRDKMARIKKEMSQERCAERR